MISNRVLEKFYLRNVQKLGLEMCEDEQVLAVPLGSTDMGNVSHIIPSIHPMFDIQASGPPHSRPFQAAAGTHEYFTFLGFQLIGFQKFQGLSLD